jgi:hypothetical protein
MTDGDKASFVRRLTDEELVDHLANAPEAEFVVLARAVEIVRRLKASVERLDRSTTRLSWMMILLAAVQVVLALTQVFRATR